MEMLERVPEHQRITIRLIGARASPVYTAFRLSEVNRPRPLSLSLSPLNQWEGIQYISAVWKLEFQTDTRLGLQMSQQEEKVCFDNDYLKGSYN